MKKARMIIILSVMIVTLGIVTYYYWYQNNHYIRTEDAKVDGDIIKICPQITGEILEMPVEEGQFLAEKDFIARQSNINLAPGSNLDLIMVKAPIRGVVLKKIAHVGEMVTPASPVIYMANPNRLYVTANIEEDRLKKVKKGQSVEFTIDYLPGISFQGHVSAIGDAANSVFSLIPQQNTGNSYIKITQRVPVKISIDNGQNQQLLPGLSAVVKITI